MDYQKYSLEIKDVGTVKFRPINENDSLEVITELLHKAYKSLFDMGLIFTATNQSVEVTKKRLSYSHQCIVGELNKEIISTITIYGPHKDNKCQWYSKDFVAKFGQYAVDPKYQMYGIGAKLIEIAEDEASEIKNVTELALDTAETAYHLITYYKKLGFRYIETISWNSTNYNSVVMSKDVKK